MTEGKAAKPQTVQIQRWKTVAATTCLNSKRTICSENILRFHPYEKPNRHHFPSPVLMLRYKPFPSFGLSGCSAGLVFLILRSFRFIFTVFFREHFSDTVKNTVIFFVYEAILNSLLNAGVFQSANKPQTISGKGLRGIVGAFWVFCYVPTKAPTKF